MPFNRKQLAQLAYAVNDSAGNSPTADFHLWRYKSFTDALAVIDDVGYFADAGADTGDGTLSFGDIIFVQDSANQDAILTITDADAGTAAQIVAGPV